MTLRTLNVRIRLGSTIVEDQTVDVERRVRLGACEDAAVAFSGATLEVWRGPDERLRLGPHLLLEDVPVVQVFGDVEVTLTAHQTAPTMPLWDRVVGDANLPDVRMLLATMAIALMMSTWGAAREFVSSDPVIQHDLAMLFGGEDVESRVRDMWSGARDVNFERDADPMAWPAVEYRE